ncbi:MAG TPA: glycosyltransferase [Terracidiphilus sp.]|nr:glycosyltransferase [Terracidiphilus sp.]
MKVAIVHPWFLEAGGAERVAGVIGSMFPKADVFTFACDPNYLPVTLIGRRIVVSALNKAMLHGGALRNYMFPLYPWASESFDVSEYDLVISSCPPVMGVNVRQDALHVCYCHTTQHSWWDQYAQHQVRLSLLKRNMFVWAAAHQRTWEYGAAQRIDDFAVNSHYVGKRLFKYFRRRGAVIYPPVNTAMGYLAGNHDNYYLTVSRLSASKRVDILIEACNRLKRRLVVVGSGRSEKDLKAIAGPTIEFTGSVSDADLPHLYAHARAFLFAADEDFGMAPVEAQAFGRPVIAYGRGGSLESVRVADPSGNPDTGIYFSDQTAESVTEAIHRFENQEESFMPSAIQEHAQRFGVSNFVNEFTEFICNAQRNSQGVDR